MRRPYLLLSWCALVAYASTSYSNEHNPSPTSHSGTDRSRLVPARFFADPANRNLDVRAVREHTERSVTIAGHYSQSIVGCGTGCVSFWIVDRRTGAIIDLPSGARDAEFVYDVRGRRDSDIIRVIFGTNPANDPTGVCRARSFRLRGTRFIAAGGISPARCP
jgi:hypothetical protein